MSSTLLFSGTVTERLAPTPAAVLAGMLELGRRLGLAPGEVPGVAPGVAAGSSPPGVPDMASALVAGGVGE